MPRFAGVPVDEPPRKPRFGGVPVKDAQPVASWGETAIDAGKSLVSGVRQGIESGLGGLGDANVINGRAASWLAEKLGASPETAQDIALATRFINPLTGALPSSGDIRQVTEPVVGAPHVPETVTGEYARTIGEFAPGAVMGPGGFGRKAAMTIVPAVMSETAGQVTKGKPIEPYARLVAAILGSGAVAAIPGAAGNSSPAVDKIMRALENDGIDPATVRQRLDEMGPDAMIADLGPNVQQQAGGLASMPGEAQQIVKSAIAGRDAGAGQRIRTTLDDTLGPAQVPSDITAGIRDNQRALGPAYEAAFANAKAVDTQPIANALDSAAVNLRGEAQTAVKSVRKMLDITGTDTLDPNPGALFQTRQAIDGMLNSTSDGNVRRVLSQARQQVDDALAQAVPGIKSVDAQFAELARQKEAVERGQTVLDSGRSAPRPTELAQEVEQGALPQGQQIGPSAVPVRLREGARAEIERIVGTNANDRVALQRIVKGEGDWNRERLATLFGQERADRIIKVLDNERTFADTSNTVTKNSLTASRVAAQNDLGNPTGNSFGIREGYMAGGVLGTARSAAVKGVEKVVDSLVGARNMARNRELAEAITSGSQSRVVDALMNSGSLPGKSQAYLGNVARALILQAPAIAASRQP